MSSSVTLFPSYPDSTILKHPLSLSRLSIDLQAAISYFQLYPLIDLTWVERYHGNKSACCSIESAQTV